LGGTCTEEDGRLDFGRKPIRDSPPGRPKLWWEDNNNNNNNNSNNNNNNTIY
jgi:hypothetical protein